MRARARGVLADLVAAPVPGGDAVHFVVSGYPPLVPRIEAQLLRGLRASAAIVLAIFVLAALAVRGRRPAGALRAAIEAAAATALTFACGWALGINVDSGSATLYLLAPFAAFYLSAGTDDPSPNTAPAVRFPAGFALALTAAGLTLLLTGVLPIMRVGAVMALALALSVLTTGLSNRYAAKRNA